MAPDKSQRVKVVGLRDLQAELKKVDLAKDLRVVNKDAAEIVASAARDAFASRSDVASEVVDSVRAEAQQRSASVRIGGSGAAGSALGAEFGSVQYSQFRPWTGNGPTAGISLYPTIRAQADQIAEHYAKSLDELTKKAFPD